MTGMSSRPVPWSEPWIWDLRPGGGPEPGEAAATVLFLPHAGGSAFSFAGWAAAIDGPVRTLGAQYPGRGPRFGEPVVRDVPLMVEPLAAALGGLEGPLLVVGHSLGAIIGFELAWWLQERRRPPCGLLASAARAPREPTLFARQPELPPDGELLALLHRTGGLPAGVLDSPELVQMVLHVVRADLELVERYQCGPGERRLRCPIVAVGGRDDPLVPVPMLESWQDYGAGPTSIHLLDGDHFYFAKQLDYLTDLVAQLLSLEVSR
jgi:surfactin synthase thioesterase subunit